MANEIWAEMSFSAGQSITQTQKADLREAFNRLGEAAEKPTELISRTLEFIGLITKE